MKWLIFPETVTYDYLYVLLVNPMYQTKSPLLWRNKSWLGTFTPSWWSTRTWVCSVDPTKYTGIEKKQVIGNIRKKQDSGYTEQIESRGRNVIGNTTLFDMIETCLCTHNNLYNSVIMHYGSFAVWLWYVLREWDFWNLLISCISYLVDFITWLTSYRKDLSFSFLGMINLQLT